MVGFQQTFQRVLEIEERFGTYTATTLPAELRGEFEVEVGRRIPDEILSTAPPFDSLAATDRPEDPCLRGSALARDKNCVDAVAELRACEQTLTNTELAQTRLDCLTKLKMWNEAAELFAALPDETRAIPKISRMGAKAERAVAKTATSSGGESALAATAFQQPTTEDLAELEELRAALRRSSRADELATILNSARQLANRFPDWTDAQYLAAESAYRLAFWQESAAFFARGGDPGDDQPRLLFFLAVSLYETGDREGAALALSRALPVLERDPFVDSYVEKILQAEEGNS